MKKKEHTKQQSESYTNNPFLIGKDCNKGTKDFFSFSMSYLRSVYSPKVRN